MAATATPIYGWASPAVAGSAALSADGSTATTTPPPPTLPGVGSTTTTTAPPPTTAPPAGSGSGSGGGSPTTAPSGSNGGVPNVPTGGPPTTASPTPAPPPNPDPILTAVDADMTQLTAISEYPQAVTDVSTKQQAVTAAVAGLQTAQAVLASAQKSELFRAQRVETASQRLEHLAIAAYIGLGYATPAAGPQGLGVAVSTVNTPGGLTGTAASDAQEMLTLVAQHVRKEVAQTRHALDKAKQVTQQAADGVHQAESNVSVAQAALQNSQAALAVLTKAATVPGIAAQIGLLGLPSLDGSAPATATASSSPSKSQTGSQTAAGQPMAGAVYAASAKPAPLAPSILGQSLLSAGDLAAWFASTGHTANTTVPIDQLAADYQTAGAATGVRFDVAFAQSVVETGFFSFPAGGQLTPADNNFAGIGACDSCAHGWHFPDAQTGVSAQLQLLEAYASPKPVPTPLIGSVGVGGCCPNWMALAGKWASSTVYGISIMTIYQQMLAWAIPQHLTAAGLTAPGAPQVGVGPTLAQLPNSGASGH